MLGAYFAFIIVRRPQKRCCMYFEQFFEAWQRVNQPLERLPHIRLQDLDRLQRDEAAARPVAQAAVA